MLTKEEFIEWMFKLYTNSWNETNKDIKQEQFMELLDYRVDYSKLQKVVTEENLSEFMPQPAWIKERLNKCLIRGTGQKWIQPRVYNPKLKVEIETDAFPYGTTEEQMIKAYEKKFNCIGWKILEVN